MRRVRVLFNGQYVVDSQASKLVYVYIPFLFPIHSPDI